MKSGGKLERTSKPPTAKDVQEIVEALDKGGRWITTHKGERLVGQPKFAEGFQYISSDTFHKNVVKLCEYLSAVTK